MSFTSQTCFPCVIMFLLYLCPRLWLIDRADNEHHMSLSTVPASNTVELARVTHFYFHSCHWESFLLFLNGLTQLDMLSHAWIRSPRRRNGEEKRVVGYLNTDVLTKREKDS